MTNAEMLNAICKGEYVEEYPNFVALAQLSIESSAFSELPQTLRVIYDVAMDAEAKNERQPAAIRRVCRQLAKEVKNEMALRYINRFLAGEDVYDLFNSFSEFCWDLNNKVARRYAEMYIDNKERHLTQKAA